MLRDKERVLARKNFGREMLDVSLEKKCSKLGNIIMWNYHMVFLNLMI